MRRLRTNKSLVLFSVAVVVIGRVVSGGRGGPSQRHPHPLWLIPPASALSSFVVEPPRL